MSHSLFCPFAIKAFTQKSLMQRQRLLLFVFWFLPVVDTVVLSEKLELVRRSARRQTEGDIKVSKGLCSRQGPGMGNLPNAERRMPNAKQNHRNKQNSLP